MNEDHRLAVRLQNRVLELVRERETLREALEPFAGAEHKVWKGTDYGDACRAAAAALGASRGSKP